MRNVKGIWIFVISLTFCSQVLAQTGWRVTQVGRLYNYWGGISLLTTVNDYLYLTSRIGGLFIYDVSNPAEPEFVTCNESLRFGRGEGWIPRLISSNDHIFVIMYYGITAINISNPVEPEEDGFFEIDNSHGFGLVDNYLYMSASWHFLNIIDISDPTDMCIVDSIEIESYSATDIKAYGDVAYVAGDNRLIIFDVENPIEPVVVETYYNFRCEKLFIIDHYLYSLAGCLDVYDLDDPLNPELITSLEEYYCDYCGISGNILIMGNFDEWYILDVSNPANPREISTYDIPNGILCFCIEESIVFYEDFDFLLRIVDISDPQHPRQIHAVDNYRVISKVEVAGDQVYLLDNYESLSIVDISDPSDPTEIQRQATPGLNLCIEDNYLYVAKQDSGLGVFDISQPHNIRERNQIIMRDDEDRLMYAKDCIVKDGIAYVTIAYGLGTGPFHLKIVDVSDPEDPADIRLYRFYSIIVDMEVSGDRLYILGSNYACIGIMDISDPQNPNLLGIRNFDGLRFYDMCITGDYAYVIADELNLFDISDPYWPIRLAEIEMDYRIKKVYAAEGFLFLCTGKDGFQIFDISNPEEPVEVGFFDTPGDAQDLSFSGDYVVVADRTNLGIYDFSDALQVSFGNVTSPREWSLLPSYPNPFNSQTRLAYRLPVESKIDLALYDLTGRLVGNLYSGVRPAGEYEILIEAGNLAAGSYFVRLETGDVRAERIITLIK